MSKTQKDEKKEERTNFTPLLLIFLIFYLVIGSFYIWNKYTIKYIEEFFIKGVLFILIVVIGYIFSIKYHIDFLEESRRENTKKEQEKREGRKELFRKQGAIALICILGFLLFINYEGISTFFHEMHHAIGASMHNSKITDFRIGNGGAVEFDTTNLSTAQLAFITIAGPIGNILINISLLFIILKNKSIKCGIFVALFSIFSLCIFEELSYLLLGLFIPRADSFKFINYLKIPPFFFYFLMVVCTILFFLSIIYFFNNKIRKIVPKPGIKKYKIGYSVIVIAVLFFCGGYKIISLLLKI